jgi:hypothetical protein
MIWMLGAVSVDLLLAGADLVGDIVMEVRMPVNNAVCIATSDLRIYRRIKCRWQGICPK